MANPFKDVKETDWFYDSVQYARINGFFSGTSKTTFDPNGTMTRGMFVTVLGRMAGVDTKEYEGQSAFSDVPATKYYAPYVAWAAKHGITSGTGDGKFSPDALINRQQMATFFVRYFEAFDIEYGVESGTTTVPADLDSASEWAKEPILKLWNRGLLVGDGTNFNPYGNATRAQAATLATRMDEVVETWYKEPDAASDRVKIDPTTGEAVTPGTTETPTTPSGGGSSSDGSSGGGGGSSS
ncbi:MAG: S-layer homology domain-containing protein, partial [Bacteroidaceae bacterium]|nr:S-layer homology domain-containing protein [Bacteroidaceae bacterium]